MKPFDEINLNYDDNGKLCKSPTTNISEKVCEENEIKYKVQQQVFVDHCIMDTTDAALNSQLETKNSQDIFVNKGNIHITYLEQVIESKKYFYARQLSYTCTDFCR